MFKALVVVSPNAAYYLNNALSLPEGAAATPAPTAAPTPAPTTAPPIPTVPTPPTIPFVLIINTLLSVSLNISWTTATNNFPAISNGLVEIAPRSTGLFTLRVNVTATPSGGSANITGLALATAYSIRVRAWSTAGSSNASTTLNFTTAASATTTGTIQVRVYFF